MSDAMTMLTTLTAVATVALFVGLGAGWFMALNYGRVKTQTELIETYKHLLDYGRATKPRATVTEGPLDAETRAMVAINDTARANLAAYISKEAGVSLERAGSEATELLSHFESTGQLPT
jgi:hypothetical protein